MKKTNKANHDAYNRLTPFSQVIFKHIVHKRKDLKRSKVKKMLDMLVASEIPVVDDGETLEEKFNKNCGYKQQEEN